MPLGSLVPNVMVENVNQTVEFYKNVLDFEVLATVPEEGQFNWAMLKNGETNLMFQTRPSLTEEIPTLEGRPIGATLTFYINTTELEAWHAKLQGKVQIVQELHTTFYGATEFGFLDCNGYILVFSQSPAQ